jgi:extracellular factor (EF) 3-hydroxypalmitic acid methyl ester biosynthesis protein
MPGVRDSGVSFQIGEGVKLQGVLERLQRHIVVFELNNPLALPRLSEVIEDLKIVSHGREIYSGRAVMRNVVDAGAKIICEAALDDAHWQDLGFNLAHKIDRPIDKEFSLFLKEWQKFYKILPEFKVTVADLQSFLYELRLWTEQIELRLRSVLPVERAHLEREACQQASKNAAPALIEMFEKFETICHKVDPDNIGAHAAFARRMLHPLLLSSPFMRRIYTKPRGYAGDYEMVGMILRDPFEGDSLFAKLLNVFILTQVPAEAHRNRVKHLLGRLIEETNRVYHLGKRCRIYNVACGPAGEVQQFLANYELSQHAEITLLDADDETLRYTGAALQHILQEHERNTELKYVKKSVYQLLKPGAGAKTFDGKYDFIYSAGLFDYLNDDVSKTIVELCYAALAPGGLLLVTNVDPVNPIRNIMEFIYEWHLIYRNGNQMAGLAADLPKDATFSVKSDLTSANVILEIRKPSQP